MHMLQSPLLHRVLLLAASSIYCSPCQTKLNAKVLYLAQCKIAGDQQPGAGFDLFRVINEEQNLHRDQAA